MQLIILGTTGMLGHQVANAFQGTLSLRQVNRADFDFSDPRHIQSFASALTPDDIVINCCGLLRQRLPKKPSPKDLHDAFIINSYLPQLVALRCRLVHISTDCVFSGVKGKYVESDLPDAADVYGRTKTLGEAPEDSLVIRTSIVGPELHRKVGLYEWFRAQSSCKGFTNHFWNGLTTKQLAKCIYKIVEKGLYFQNGVFHIFSETVSKYTLLSYYFNKLLDVPIPVEPVEAPVAVDRTLATEKSWFQELMQIPPLSEQIEKMG